jgi:hypothetical protein
VDSQHARSAPCSYPQCRAMIDARKSVAVNVHKASILCVPEVFGKFHLIKCTECSVDIADSPVRVHVGGLRGVLQCTQNLVGCYHCKLRSAGAPRLRVFVSAHSGYRCYWCRRHVAGGNSECRNFHRKCEPRKIVLRCR